MDNGVFARWWLFIVSSLILILLPFLGVMLVGKELAVFLQFPPLTRYVEHAGFSWLVFTAMALFVLFAAVPLMARALLSPAQDKDAPSYPFPLWGWGSIFLCLVSWILAWTRFGWFVDYQIFTFSPLWLGYIGIVNALTYARSGQCMLTQRPKHLLKLFIVSAVFWWYFEYLNRYVQNWYYIGIDGLSTAQYVLFATLPFATVLPAVIGTYELLETFPRLNAGLKNYTQVEIDNPKMTALTVLMVASLSLLGIGIYPDYLYPFLWLSPLFILTSMQRLAGMETIFTPLRRGNWSRIFLLAVSALICGFFWEMWNYFSYAKWIYSIPFVQKFHVFEMPLIGYAGYLSFGLECGVVADCWVKNVKQV
jgi:hypothetical protein